MLRRASWRVNRLRNKISSSDFEGTDFKRNRASHKRRRGKTSPTQTNVHSEQCPCPLMEAAQLVSKALHGPKGASSTSSSRGLFSESCDLPPGESSRLSWRLEALNYANWAIPHSRTEKYTGIRNCNVPIWSLCRPKISDTSIRHVPVCALVEFSLDNPGYAKTGKLEGQQAQK